MHFERIEVSCREEYRAQQEPLTFTWRNRQYRIHQIVDRWYEGYPSPRRAPQRYFRVETDDGQRFIVRYNELFDAWSLLVPQPEKPVNDAPPS